MNCFAERLMLYIQKQQGTGNNTIRMSFEERLPVLHLFQSYLSGRTQCISIEGVLSELKELVYGVPQGSVLGPLEFCIYTFPI